MKRPGKRFGLFFSQKSVCWILVIRRHANSPARAVAMGWKSTEDKLAKNPGNLRNMICLMICSLISGCIICWGSIFRWFGNGWQGLNVDGRTMKILDQFLSILIYFHLWLSELVDFKRQAGNTRVFVKHWAGTFVGTLRWHECNWGGELAI